MNKHHLWWVIPLCVAVGVVISIPKHMKVEVTMPDIDAFTASAEKVTQTLRDSDSIKDWYYLCGLRRGCNIGCLNGTTYNTPNYIACDLHCDLLYTGACNEDVIPRIEELQ